MFKKGLKGWEIGSMPGCLEANEQSGSLMLNRAKVAFATGARGSAEEIRRARRNPEQRPQIQSLSISNYGKYSR